jgi:hypothetical protein
MDSENDSHGSSADSESNEIMELNQDLYFNQEFWLKMAQTSRTIDLSIESAEVFFDAVSSGECLLDGSNNPEGLMLWGEAILILFRFINSSIYILQGIDEPMIDMGFMERIPDDDGTELIFDNTSFIYPEIKRFKHKEKNAEYCQNDTVYGQFEVGESSSAAEFRGVLSQTPTTQNLMNEEIPVMDQPELCDIILQPSEIQDSLFNSVEQCANLFNDRVEISPILPDKTDEDIDLFFDSIGLASGTEIVSPPVLESTCVQESEEEVIGSSYQLEVENFSSLVAEQLQHIMVNEAPQPEIGESAEPQRINWTVEDPTDVETTVPDPEVENSDDRKWGDTSDDEQLDEEFGSDDFDEGEESDAEEEEYKPSAVAEIEDQTCKCYEFIDGSEAIKYLEDLPSKIDYFKQTYKCEINNILKVFEFFCNNNKELDDAKRLACVDIFYRTRHELLFKVLCLAYNLPYEKSDIKFSEFGIDSNRTPDLILNSNGKLIIVEVSASSSIERSAVAKGLEEAGFESKYKTELDMLDSQGTDYDYVPILFDMSVLKSYDYLNMLTKLEKYYNPNDLYKQIMKIVREDLCIITQQIKNYLSAPSSILFAKLIPINPKHNELSFMYNFRRDKIEYSEKYVELCVSGPIYNKIINNWGRLERILERYSENSFVTLFVDTSTHRIAIKPGGNLKVSDYIDIIRRDSKLELFKELKVKLGTEFKPATDSIDGLKYIIKTDKEEERQAINLNLLVTHTTTIYKEQGFRIFDYSNYQRKIDNYFSYNYESKAYNSQFEDNFVGLILKNDKLNNQSFDSEYTLTKDVKFLANNALKDIDIEFSFKQLTNFQSVCNVTNDSLPVRINKNKNPFLLPLASLNPSNYSDLSHKNKVLYNEIQSEIINTDPFTCLILNRVCEPDFEFIRDKGVPSKIYQDLMKDRVSLSRKMTQLQRLYHKSINHKVKERLSQTTIEEFKVPYREINEKLRFVNKSIRSRSKLENICNQTQLIRLPTKNKKTSLGSMFLKEMSHYKNRKEQSTITGVGYRESISQDFENDRGVFGNITGWLSEHCGYNRVKLLDDTETEDCRLLKELKKSAHQDYSQLIKSVTESNLGHASAFVSNFAHSLLYYSQMPFNSEYIRVDNLGLNNVLLIVRGGKKIFRSKASKMYRLIYPICEQSLPWVETGFGLKSSTRIMNIKGVYYALSPWQQLHESILNDSISFYTRICSFAILNLDTKMPFNYSFNKISFNILLSFHNRRQTEVMLANLRYILLATLGDFTGIMDIFKEFLGFNYDCFQSYVRGCILFNYPEYFSKLKSVKDKKDKTPSFRDYVQKAPKNLFTGSDISSEEDLAVMIYSTFLMTKAPYQRPVERAINLKGILEIHEYFEKTVKCDINDFKLSDMYRNTTVNVCNYNNLSEYANDIFRNDFNYDPAYCAQVGVFADSYFANRGLKEEIFTTWNSILNSCWDELSTSTGLRGKFDDLQNFWGQKGYFVVYKSLVDDHSYMSDVKRLLKTNLDDDKKRKLLRDLNLIFKVKIEEPQEFLLFHAVDKVQWRGGREIYVMDIDTKTVQQPIEKFMGYLCSKVDNELISIPSDKRAQVIHHSIFERDIPTTEILTWYLTLDCSKWAPKSNFLKFVDMILPMSVLPPTFKTHFMNYIQKLFKKRVYFNTMEVDVLQKNQMYKKIVQDYLKFDTVHKGYYLEMHYSWVMGIFNYTSSFLHAMNQKYASYIIFKTSIVSYNSETSLFMFAHSDDSGGRLSCESEHLMVRALTLYELQLKMCNHILSKKKSVVSRFYFEILSVIYIFKKLLALLPKFLGGLRFLPSDKGPCHDMLASYSKCIEVMVAGACFNVAYLVMKMYSQMVYSFYNHTPIKSNVYELPVQYFGLPDAHPLMVLLCGSDSDILRIIFTKGNDYLAKLHAFFNKITQTIDDEGPIKPVKFNIQVRGIKKGFEDSISEFTDQISTWSISNVNFHSTPLNLMSFLSKLNDPGFIGSLVNESPIRRISRAYFMRKGHCIKTIIGDISMAVMYDIMDMFLISIDRGNPYSDIIPLDIYNELANEIKSLEPSSLKQIEALVTTLNSPLRICRYMNEITMDGKEIVINTRTIKPTHVELTKSPKTFSVNFDPAQMVSYMKEPEYSWALPNLRNLFTGRAEVESLCADYGINIDEMSASTLLKICRTYSSKYKKSIYMYSQVPSEIRQIKTYSSFLTFLSTNTYQNREIKGLVLRLRGNLTDPGYLPVNIDEDVYLINSMLGIIKTFMKVSGISIVKSLSVNKLPVINFTGGSVNELLSHCQKMSKEMEDAVHFNLQLCYVKDRLLDKFSPHTDASFIKNSSFYYFPKNQKSQGGWFGKGTLIIYISGPIYQFELYNNLAISLKTNQTGKLKKMDVSYILDVFSKSGLTFSQRNVIERNKKVFGVDQNGDYSILRSIEIPNGIPAEDNAILPSVVDHCERMEIKESGPNSFLVIQDGRFGKKSNKIYTLPLLQGEIINIIKMLFNPKEFGMLVLEKGVNDFEEYVLTEIMTEFGFEATIGPTEFFDNYQASEIYRVFQSVKKNSYSLLPKKPEKNYLPASEGGILRILIDYTRCTGENLITTPQNLTPELMELRSQHPDSVVAILSDRLIKCHNEIYTGSEVNEIKAAYEGLYIYKDKQDLERNFIKLLVHWGYGSLVNSLDNFTIAKKDSNFSYFNLGDIDKIESRHTSETFFSLHKIICKSMYQQYFLYDNLTMPVQRLYNKKGVAHIINDMNINLTYGLYKVNYCMGHYNHSRAVFLNALLAYLEDEDFINSLIKNSSHDYVLSSLNFNFKNRVNIIAMYNTMMYVFIRVNGKNHDLDATKKLDRLGASIENPISMYQKLCIDGLSDHVPKFSVYYHNFLNDDIVSFMSSATLVESSGYNYRVSMNYCRPSEQSVPLTNLFSLKYVLNDDVFDNENWEEIISTIEMGGAEKEDIEEYWDEIKPKFKKLRTKVLAGGKTIQTVITWVIDPYLQNMVGCESFYRQCGENIVVVTTDYLEGFEFMPNSHIRKVNLGNILFNKTCKDMIMYISCSKHLNMRFWNKFIGGVVIDNIDASVINSLHMDDYFVGRDKIGHFTDRKVSHDDFFTTAEQKMEKLRMLEEEGKAKEQEAKITETNEEFNDKVKNLVEDAFKSGYISKRVKWQLIERYTNKSVLDTLQKDDLFLSFMNEINLRELHKNLVEGNVKNLTSEKYNKIFQSPEHFGMAHTRTNDFSKGIKDKKVNAELNSIHSKLSNLIAADNLMISPLMHKNITAHYKMWVSVTKGCKYKKENKKFMILLFLTILNSAKVLDGVDKGSDDVWQDVSNLYTIYIADDGPEDDDMEDFFTIDENLVSASRLKYKASGF